MIQTMTMRRDGAGIVLLIDCFAGAAGWLARAGCPVLANDDSTALVWVRS